MKIAIYNVTTSFQLGGIETYCIEMGSSLRNMGHEVDWIAGDGKEILVENREGFILFPYTPRELFWNFGTRFRKLMERLSFAKNTFSHLMKADYDAIIITKPYDFPLAWALKKRGYKGKIIFHTGGTDFFGGDRFFSQAIDYFIACSSYTAKQNQDRYARDFHVIYNGVDAQLFQPVSRESLWRIKMGIPASAAVIMTVGRVVGWKGLDTIVKAIVPLNNVHYVYVGTGPYATRLNKQALEMGIESRVHAAGAYSHRFVPGIMNQADIFAQPSIGEEAFGITLVEAMACGLPVLASAQGGMLEIVEDGINGFLLPPGDVSSWRQAITTIISAKEKYHHMRTAARKAVLTKFTWKKAAAKLDVLLRMKHTL